MLIHRRKFLKIAGGIAATVPFRSLTLGKEKKMSVGVVGGGIVGASIAMHLSKNGANVTLFEKSAPAKGATGKSFAWINAFSNDPHYRSLRLKSISAYHELDRELQLEIIWGGAIHWAENLAEAERMKANVEEFNQAGYSSHMITPEYLAELAPNLRLGPFVSASFTQLDGHLDPVSTTRALLNQAKQYGAKIIYPCEVTELLSERNRFTGISTTTGTYSLDRIVIAAGVDTPTLAAKAGYTPPLIHAPGILVHTKQTVPLINQVIESPHMYFKQYRDGRIIGASPWNPPDIPEHQDILKGPQKMPNKIREMHGERILDRIKNKLPGASDTAYDHLTLGFRPLPKDGYPIVGFSPDNSNVYIAVMHSGVTLAAIMGRYISHEIINNDLIDELAPYRPDRF